MSATKWFSILLVMSAGLLSIIHPASWTLWIFIISGVLTVLSFVLSPHNDSE